jgi:hypothetical protein
MPRISPLVLKCEDEDDHKDEREPREVSHCHAAVTPVLYSFSSQLVNIELYFFDINKVVNLIRLSKN